jgi:hypothetical protein
MRKKPPWWRAIASITITLYPVWGVPSYFNVNVASGGLINGMYDAWCLDPVGSISRGTIYPVTVYSSYSAYGSIDGVLPSGQVDLDLDGYYDSLQAVNWIFNNIVEPGNVVLEPSPSSAFTNSYSYNIDGVAGNETFTSGDVQWAIWKVLGAPPAEISAGLGSLIDYDHSGVMAQNIANLAIAEGVAFVPVAGQDIGIILSPGGNNPSHSRPSLRSRRLESATRSSPIATLITHTTSGKASMG